jgi:hypothetical protein
MEEGVTYALDARRSRAVMTIISLDPLSYIRHGSFLSRGPELNGSFGILGLITAQRESSDGLTIFAAIEAGGNMYGVPVTATTLNGLAGQVMGEQAEYFRVVEVEE